jgi:hypothetical protein
MSAHAVKFLILIVVTCPLAQPGAAWADAYPPKIKRIHPPLVLRSIEDAAAVSIDSFRGKKVLLIHFATWSPASHDVAVKWQAATRKLVADGKLIVLGVVQAHHRDRCRLLAQWKGLAIPLVYDPLNLAGVTEVPKIVGLDEYGAVRIVDPDSEEELQTYATKRFKKGKRHPRSLVLDIPDPKYTARIAGEARNVRGWRDHGDALVLAGTPPHLDEAIRTYERTLKLDSSDALSHFRLGVALWIRSHRPERQPGDFQAATTAWGQALGCDPKNDVLRAQCTQFGLLEEKRASLFGWISTAREEIADRGETPVALACEPAAVELAGPRKKFVVAENVEGKPEVDGGAVSDTRKLIEFEAAIVRPVSPKKKRYRQVLLVFRPSAFSAGKWHNTGEPLRVWLDAPKGVQLDRRFIEHAGPSSSTSEESRILNVEVKLPKKAKGKPVKIKGVAVYSAIAGEDPQLLRCEFEVEVK